MPWLQVQRREAAAKGTAAGLDGTVEAVATLAADATAKVINILITNSAVDFAASSAATAAMGFTASRATSTMGFAASRATATMGFTAPRATAAAAKASTAATAAEVTAAAETTRTFWRVRTIACLFSLRPARTFLCRMSSCTSHTTKCMSPSTVQYPTG